MSDRSPTARPMSCGQWTELRRREADAEQGLKDIGVWRASLHDAERRATADADDKADSIVSDHNSQACVCGSTYLCDVR